MSHLDILSHRQWQTWIDVHQHRVFLILVKIRGFVQRVVEVFSWHIWKLNGPKFRLSNMVVWNQRIPFAVCSDYELQLWCPHFFGITWFIYMDNNFLRCQRLILITIQCGDQFIILIHYLQHADCPVVCYLVERGNRDSCHQNSYEYCLHMGNILPRTICWSATIHHQKSPAGAEWRSNPIASTRVGVIQVTGNAFSVSVASVTCPWMRQVHEFQYHTQYRSLRFTFYSPEMSYSW